MCFVPRQCLKGGWRVTTMNAPVGGAGQWLTIQCFTIQRIITDCNSVVAHWPVNMVVVVHTHPQRSTHRSILHTDWYGCTDSQRRETVYELTLSCCWSSLLRRVNTAFVSLFLRIAIWISFFCLDSSLRDKIRFYICFIERQTYQCLPNSWSLVITVSFISV